jgi:hypothetical protein
MSEKGTSILLVVGKSVYAGIGSSCRCEHDTWASSRSASLEAPSSLDSPRGAATDSSQGTPFFTHLAHGRSSPHRSFDEAQSKHACAARALRPPDSNRCRHPCRLTRSLEFHNQPGTISVCSRNVTHRRAKALPQTEQANGFSRVSAEALDQSSTSSCKVAFPIRTYADMPGKMVNSQEGSLTVAALEQCVTLSGACSHCAHFAGSPRKVLFGPSGARIFGI